MVGRFKVYHRNMNVEIGTMWPRNSFSVYPIRTVSNVFEKFSEINLLRVSGVVFTGNNCSLVSMTPAINLSPVSMTPAMTENP